MRVCGKNYRAEKATNIWVIVVPSIRETKYLIHLYKEVLYELKGQSENLSIYSPQISSSTMKCRFMYLYELFYLLLNRKNREDKKILHIQWVEFLYLWGKHKYLTLILIPLVTAFLKFFKRFSANKVATTVHNLLPHNVKLLHLEYSFFQFILQDITDCVFVHSLLHKNLLMKLYGIGSKKIFLIKHGFFTKPKLSRTSKNKQCLVKLGVSHNDIVFSLTGAISEYKGVSVLLEAMKKLLVDMPEKNIKLIIAGKAEGTYLLYLMKKYSNILNNRHVILINKWLTEIELEEIYSATDFGICPYTNATTPATLLDFMSHKLPIITTDNVNVLSVIKDYPAIISKQGDPLSLAQTISFACANLLEYQRRAENFNDMASFTYAWRDSAKITITCYQNLAQS